MQAEHALITELHRNNQQIREALNVVLALGPGTPEGRRTLRAVRRQVEEHLAREDDTVLRRLCAGEESDRPPCDQLLRLRSYLPRLFDDCEQAPPREALMAHLRLSAAIRRRIICQERHLYPALAGHRST